ncbi:MAG TPA: cytochrome c biogenesis protein ResB [Candidatus Limnocylindria bacterium]|nr:cytochrome c biogenesis protein ResB [Candidatus Limnocylindria bacterium]
MLKRIIDVVSSLKLTVVLLSLGIALVFFGTLGQVSDGLYLAQQKYFRSWFTYWHPAQVSWLILPLPGGYFLGTSLLINLITAHVSRFRFSWKKSGIWMTHFGIILLLIGQLVTDMFATESHIRLTEGQSKNYSDSSQKNELAVTILGDSGNDTVVAFPESLVKQKGELQHPSLPFRIKVKEYFVNSGAQPRGPRSGGQPQADHGVAQFFTFEPAPETFAMDDRNIPGAIVEVIGSKGSLGTWVTSLYTGDDSIAPSMARRLAKMIGPQLAERLGAELMKPQEFETDGKRFRIAYRPVRFYTPQWIELVKFTNEKYLGTDIPKDYRSRVRLQNPSTGEKRELDIYMNSPLRYNGLTYYQSSFDPFDSRVTVLQVVKNPGWLTPYAGCSLVAGGLLVQFLIHLVGFITKRRTA